MEFPAEDTRAFRVFLYNREVRSVVKDNRSHSYYNDEWADTRCHEVQAHSETEARRLVSKRYPPEDGFVIEKVASVN